MHDSGPKDESHLLRRALISATITADAVVAEAATAVPIEFCPP